MKDKRRIINMLRNPDEKTLERLTSEYPQAEKNQKDKMYEKVKERMSSSDNVFTDEVSGVEKYRRRPLWRLVPAAVMSLALVCGVVGGGAYMLKNSSVTVPSTEVTTETEAMAATEATTETATEESSEAATDTATEASSEAETEAATEAATAEQISGQTDITKEQIYALCENCRTQNFDRISYSYKLIYYYDTGYRDETIGEFCVDNTQNTESKTVAPVYYRGDGSVVYNNSATEYFCNGKRATVYVQSCPDSPDEFDNRKMLQVEERDVSQQIDSESKDGKELLANFDDWDIIGTEEYLGRKCAVISGRKEFIIEFEKSPDQEDNSEISIKEYTAMIDLETGVFMKSNIKDTNYDLQDRSFIITDIGYGDNAKLPMSKDEFRQFALDDCYKMENGENGQPEYVPVNEADLAYLG